MGTPQLGWSIEEGAPVVVRPTNPASHFHDGSIGSGGTARADQIQEPGSRVP